MANCSKECQIHEECKGFVWDREKTTCHLRFNITLDDCANSNSKDIYMLNKIKEEEKDDGAEQPWNEKGFWGQKGR